MEQETKEDGPIRRALWSLFEPTADQVTGGHHVLIVRNIVCTGPGVRRAERSSDQHEAPVMGLKSDGSRSPEQYGFSVPEPRRWSRLR